MWLNTHVSSNEFPLSLGVRKLFPKAQSYLESWQWTAMVSKCLQFWRNPIRKKKCSETLIIEHTRLKQAAKAPCWFLRLKQEWVLFTSLRGAFSPDAELHVPVPICAFLRGCRSHSILHESKAWRLRTLLCSTEPMRMQKVAERSEGEEKGREI